MAINFTPNQLAEAFVAQYAKACPFLLNTNKTLDRKFTAGNGMVMNVVVPPYAVIGEDTAVIDQSTQLNYESGVKQVVLRQYNAAFAPNQAQRAHDILDLSAQVLVPYAQSLASKVQAKAISDTIGQAGHTVVVNALDSSSNPIPGVVDMNKMRGASMLITKSRAYGERFGIIDPLILASATNLQNYFLPSDIAKTIWAEAELGAFASAKWIGSADCLNIEIPDTTVLDLTGASIATASVAGDDSLEVSWTNATTDDCVLKAGTPFKVGSVKSVDIYGNKTTEDKVFTITKDLEIASGSTSASFPIVPVYTPADSMAECNVDVLPDAADTVEYYPGIVAGKTYAVGVCYDKDSVFVAQAGVEGMAGTEFKGQAEAPQGALVSYTAGPDILNGREVGRFDTLVGSTVARPSWVTEILLQID